VKLNSSLLLSTRINCPRVAVPPSSFSFFPLILSPRGRPFSQSAWSDNRHLWFCFSFKTGSTEPGAFLFRCKRVPVFIHEVVPFPPRRPLNSGLRSLGTFDFPLPVRSGRHVPCTRPRIASIVSFLHDQVRPPLFLRCTGQCKIDFFTPVTRDLHLTRPPSLFFFTTYFFFPTHVRFLFPSTADAARCIRFYPSLCKAESSFFTAAPLPPGVRFLPSSPRLSGEVRPLCRFRPGQVAFIFSLVTVLPLSRGPPSGQAGPVSYYASLRCCTLPFCKPPSPDACSAVLTRCEPRRPPPFPSSVTFGSPRCPTLPYRTGQPLDNGTAVLSGGDLRDRNLSNKRYPSSSLQTSSNHALGLSAPAHGRSSFVFPSLDGTFAWPRSPFPGSLFQRQRLHHQNPEG